MICKIIIKRLLRRWKLNSKSIQQEEALEFLYQQTIAHWQLKHSYSNRLRIEVDIK